MSVHNSSEILDMKVTEGHGDGQKTDIKESVVESVESVKEAKDFQTSVDECIVLVGTTGTGKTSLLNIYTGNKLECSESAQSVTFTTTTLDDKLHPMGPKWIDNPGWADTTGRSDMQLFKQMLRHMQSAKLYNVKAVVWCVMPTPRMDANLQAQADFIDMFTVEDDKTPQIEAGMIWPNVVIVCKGKVAADIKDDAGGALMTAKEKNIHAKPLTLRWEFALPEVITGVPEQIRRETLRMLTNDEIREELHEAFSKLPPCVQVVFAHQKCLACGQEGDPRLMEDKCHRSRVRGHTGILRQRFSKVEAGATLGGGAVGTLGLTAAAIAAATPAVLIALPFVLGPGLVVGGHRLLNAGKDDPPPFAGIKITDMRWTCCGSSEMKEGGCTDLCDQCGAVWGAPDSPPCVLIKHPDINLQKGLEGYQVHIKDHELVNIAIEPNPEKVQ